MNLYSELIKVTEEFLRDESVNLSQHKILDIDPEKVTPYQATFLAQSAFEYVLNYDIKEFNGDEKEALRMLFRRVLERESKTIVWDALTYSFDSDPENCFYEIQKDDKVA